MGRTIARNLAWIHLIGTIEECRRRSRAGRVACQSSAVISAALPSLHFDFGPAFAATPVADEEPRPTAKKGRGKLRITSTASADATPVAEGSSDGVQVAQAVVQTVLAPVALFVPAPAPVPTPVVEAEIVALPVVRQAPVERSDAGVLVFDVETTGTDKRRDQVIELCIQFGLDAGARSQTWRFRPTVPISPGAQAVHGISMEELIDCPPFAACAEEIAAIFARAEVIVGYNLSFDIDMLQAEYERMRTAAAERGGLPVVTLETRGKTIVDPYRLWQQCEPRSLQHAHQRFVGQGFEAAHSASADVAATGRVLSGMLRTFGLDEHDWRGIAGVCDPQRPSWVGPSRHLQWDGPAIVITFGKHAGSQVHELARGELRDYLRWVCDRDFPFHVREICRRALEVSADEFLGWVRTQYGQPAEPSRPVAASATAS
jgi:DNA polymerase-3 subunit epsilon